MYSKNNISKIEDCLFYSYTFQTILFGFLIYTLTKIKNEIDTYYNANKNYPEKTSELFKMKNNLKKNTD